MFKVDVQELKAAVLELEARNKGENVEIKIDGRKLILSVTDRGDNTVEAIVYSDSNLSAKLRHTERLMFMKDRKGNL